MNKLELTYISDRLNQYRYVDKDGEWQWLHPVSVYKAIEPILRGQAVSVVSAEEANSDESDPSPYVRLTDTSKDVKSIGLAFETVQAGEKVHILPFGRFDFDKRYDGIEGLAEYDPGFTYADVGKKVYVKNGHNGCLTVDEEEILKSYNHIICVGHLTDAPVENTNQTMTTIEVTISGDERGPVDHTQFEGILGEDVYIPENDPIRLFAYGSEEDKNFSFKLRLTPQGEKKKFNSHDFIAIQKYDGKTVYLYPGDSLDLAGLEDDSDAAFVRMSRLYAQANGGTAETTVKINLNSEYSGDGVDDNLAVLNTALQNAFKEVSGFESSVVIAHSNTEIPYGSLELTSNEPGGYYTLYISSGLLSSFEGSGVSEHGSFNNKGKVVLADVRIPTRRNIIGAYYGTKFGTLEAGYSTIFLRLGEYTLNPENLADTVAYKSTSSNDIRGQEFYLGYNGRLTTIPYSQFDYVSKVATLKTESKLLFDVGNATRHYNGELPVGYMKPSIMVEDDEGGVKFYPEYGFFLLDGVSEYPIAEPYLTVYNRLCGHFSAEELQATKNNYFKVPHVTKQNTPMQMKYLSEGIYEDLPRIPFIRTIGKFAAEPENQEVPVTLPEIEITSLIDYGISDEGYTKPGLDNLDIHLYIDPNKDYVSGPHDWREVKEGFFNFNTYGTYGFSWTIREDLTIVNDKVPYGRYYLSTNIGDSLGISYVDGTNQAPLRLDNCYFKLYIARREVFQRQFDLDGIFKDYISDSVYNTNGDPEERLAVSGKAVLDAIEQKKDVSKIFATEGAIIKLGDTEKNITTDVIELISKNDLPIVSKEGKVIIGNGLDANYEQIVIENGKVYKVNTSLNDDIYKAVDTEYTVDGDIIPNARQVRAHAEATIDGKDYVQNYASNTEATNATGKIHGMIFGMDGNVDASMLAGLKAKFSSKQQLTLSDNTDNAYIPIVSKNSAGAYSMVMEGFTIHLNPSGTEVMRKNVTSKKDAAIDNHNLFSNGTTYISSVNNYSGDAIYQTAYYPDNNLIAFFKGEAPEDVDFENLEGMSNVKFANIVAGEITRGSWSKTKKIFGERYNNAALFTTDLAEGSKQYEDNDNPYASIRGKLGSALQAAYELPLAYWRGNGDKDWYKKSLGIVVERVRDVAENITTSDEREIFADKYNYTENEIESIQNYFGTLTNSVGQDTSSTIGMLLAAAKETQERLLQIETSTFGKDCERIPGNKKPTFDIGITGVNSNPTTYGLNRLVRAICAELYGTVDPNDAEAFKIEGNQITSLSRIDTLDRDIHGTSNTVGDKANVTAGNLLSDISSTTYPYNPVYYRENNAENEAAGINVETLENFKAENPVVSSNPDTFNGTIDAIERITKKLNKLTEEVNGADNINLGPKVIFTIDDKVREIIDELYYQGNNEIPEDKKSRLDELSRSLFNYTLTKRNNVAASNEFAADWVGTNKGLIFNGKVANIPLDTNIDDTSNTKEATFNDNSLGNYEYASVIDVIIDALGSQWFRKHHSTTGASLEDKRLESSITDRLANIERILDDATTGLDKANNGKGFENYSNGAIISSTGVEEVLETIAYLLCGDKNRLNPNVDDYGLKSAEETINHKDLNMEGDKQVTDYTPTNIMAGLRNILLRLTNLEKYNAIIQKAIGNNIYTNEEKHLNQSIVDGLPSPVFDTITNTISYDIQSILNTIFGTDQYRNAKEEEPYIEGNNLVAIAQQIYRVPSKYTYEGNTAYCFLNGNPSYNNQYQDVEILTKTGGILNNETLWQGENRFTAIEKEIYNIRCFLGLMNKADESDDAKRFSYLYNFATGFSADLQEYLPNLVVDVKGRPKWSSNMGDNEWGVFEKDDIINEILFTNNATRNLRAVVGNNSKLGTYLDADNFTPDLQGAIKVAPVGTEKVPTGLDTIYTPEEYNTLRANTSNEKTLIDRISKLEEVIVSMHDYIKRNIAGGYNTLDNFYIEIGGKKFVPYADGEELVVGSAANGLGGEEYDKFIKDFTSFFDESSTSTLYTVSDTDNRKVSTLIKGDETHSSLAGHMILLLQLDENTKLDTINRWETDYNPIKLAYKENNTDAVITFNGKTYCANNTTTGNNFTSYIEERKYQSQLLQDIASYIDGNSRTANESGPTTGSLI